MQDEQQSQGQEYPYPQQPTFNQVPQPIPTPNSQPAPGGQGFPGQNPNATPPSQQVFAPGYGQPMQPQYPPAQPQTQYSASPAPQPWAAPSPQQTYSGYPQPPQPMAAYGTHPKRKLPLAQIAVAATAVVIVALLAFLGTRLIHGPIKHADVLSAIQVAQNMDQDLTDARFTYDSTAVGSDSNATTIATAVNTINSKLEDAQSQLNNFKKSPVLGDATVSKDFQAYEKKFGPYVDYLKQNTSDYAKLSPVVNTAMSKLQPALTNTPTSNSGMSSYLSSIKSVIDSSLSQLNKIQVSSTTNKQGLTAFKSYLQSLSGAVNTAQSDLKAGKDYYVVEGDLLNTGSAETKFIDAVDNINQQESANLKQLDPENEFGTLTSALTALSLKVKN